MDNLKGLSTSLCLKPRKSLDGCGESAVGIINVWAGKPLALRCRVWVLLRVKEHLVSKVLAQRLQGDASNTVQQAAFEQVLS